MGVERGRGTRGAVGAQAAAAGEGPRHSPARSVYLYRASILPTGVANDADGRVKPPRPARRPGPGGAERGKGGGESPSCGLWVGRRRRRFGRHGSKKSQHAFFAGRVLVSSSVGWGPLRSSHHHTPTRQQGGLSDGVRTFDRRSILRGGAETIDRPPIQTGHKQEAWVLRG